MSESSFEAPVASGTIERELRAHLQRFEGEALHREYESNDDFVVVKEFLPAGLLERAQREIDTLRPLIHRNYVPGRKKGGSVDHDGVREHAPLIHAIHSSPSLFALLGQITAAPLHHCPEHDLHRCALYAYTEEGDHIAWHYDTSFYRGRRFTVLLPLIDRSSARLLYRSHTRVRGKQPVEGALATQPGSLIVFDGDKLYHAVSPIAADEERFLITMEFVTDPRMGWLMRLVSDAKDAFAYFGLRKVFARFLP